MKRVIYLFFSAVLSVSTMLAQGGPSTPGPPCPTADCDVDDVLPLEQDLLMIFLAVGLAVFYFNRKSLFGAKKNNS